MKTGSEIIVKAPKGIDCDMKQWGARYAVQGQENAWLITIESRSSIEVVVAKIAISNSILGLLTNYYISSPNFRIAIPSVPSLEETYWIADKLLECGMPAPDAVTVAQVLYSIGEL